MAQQIRIKIEGVEFKAELNDSPTATDIAAALPIKGRGNKWGDEFYFKTPIKRSEESGARANMEVGELAYWPPGQAFCILFGPTPASSDDTPMMASPSNPIGKITGDASPLKTFSDGVEIVVENDG